MRKHIDRILRTKSQNIFVKRVTSEKFLPTGMTNPKDIYTELQTSYSKIFISRSIFKNIIINITGGFERDF